MKKIFGFFATVLALFGLASCGSKVDEVAKEAHAAFIAVADGEVTTVEGYVAAKQSWWDNKGTIYLLDNNSEGYFIYNLPCTEEQYNTDLAIGNKIKVTGVKGSWAGQIEILGQDGEGATYEVLEGTKSSFTPIELNVADVKEEHMNSYFTIKSVEVSAAPTFQNDNNTGDIYFAVKDADGNTISCCIESYLTGTDTEVYQTASQLVLGDKITITGYMYWYNGANPHIVKIVKA